MNSLDEPRDERWKALIARLDTAYRAEGRAALEKMEGIEALALWNEKVRDYKILGRQLEAEPGNEAARRGRAELLREINDIGGWIKAKQNEQDHRLREEPQSGVAGQRPRSLEEMRRDAAERVQAKTKTRDHEQER